MYRVVRNFVDRIDKTPYKVGDIYHGDISEARIAEITTKNNMQMTVLVEYVPDEVEAPAHEPDTVVDDVGPENIIPIGPRRRRKRGELSN